MPASPPTRASSARRRVVLPGRRRLRRCMEALRATGWTPLAHGRPSAGVPFLGICVGMQLLYDGSRGGAGRHAASAILHGTVRLLPDDVKHPQMQWNLLERRGDPALAGGVPEPAWAYFVHSYAADTDDASSPPATTAARSRPPSSGGTCGPPSSTPRSRGAPGWPCSGLRRARRGLVPA